MGGAKFLTDERDAVLMELALREARQAREKGEAPVGAVLVDSDGTVVASDHNRREQNSDPTAHAEILVLAAAAKARGDWRLTDLTLYVTLEPCPMCAGAAVNARLARVVYGAADPKAGAAWSLYNILGDSRLNHRCQVAAGVRADEVTELMASFFATRRQLA